MNYRMEKYLRTAQRKNRTLIFNSLKGTCIALDEGSYKIVKYIMNKFPTGEQLENFAKDMNVSEASLHKFLDCLKEKGFLYEDIKNN
ncbi:MAG: hypothetical protein K2P87_07650 [Lachnospiraceae bacterium]|nr:hypothetical protein [Lachnospiraceae bacterium]